MFLSQVTLAREMVVLQMQSMGTLLEGRQRSWVRCTKLYLKLPVVMMRDTLQISAHERVPAMHGGQLSLGKWERRSPEFASPPVKVCIRQLWNNHELHRATVLKLTISENITLRTRDHDALLRDLYVGIQLLLWDDISIAHARFCAVCL